MATKFRRFNAGQLSCPEDECSQIYDARLNLTNTVGTITMLNKIVKWYFHSNGSSHGGNIKVTGAL